ncbi:MAG: PKD domain-containing protein, partial [Thermoplasmata archaeon]
MAIILASVLIASGAISILLYDNPVADAGEDRIVDVGEMIYFDASASQGAILYYWNFRDNGWVNTSAVTSRTYSIEGVYDVALVVTSITGKQDLDTVRITVRNEPPIANAGEDVVAFEDEIITFDASATVDSAVDINRLSYHWDFGDGCNASGKIATHSYSKSGRYTALLSVRDDQGAIGRDVKIVTVLNRPPSGRVLETASNEGDAIILTAVGNDTPSDIASLRFEWDNGKLGAKTAYTFNDDGIYHPQVTIRDDDNVSASAIGNLVVQNVAPITGILSATVKANITLRAAGEKWHDLQLQLFKEGSSVANLSVYRTPGDPNLQAATISNFSFDLSSNYRAVIKYTPEDDPVNGQPQGATPAWLILTFEDGSSEIFEHAFNVEQPDAWEWALNLTSCFVGHEIIFSAFAFDQGRDDITMLWEFGDGTRIITEHTADDNSPVYFVESITHRYSSYGNFEISLTAVDGDNGCGSFSTKLSLARDRASIENLAPKVSLIGSIGTILEDTAYLGIANATDDTGEIVSFEWSFGDGSISEESQSPFGSEATHIYTFSGEYLVSVKAIDSYGARGIAFSHVRVINSPPSAIIMCYSSVVSQDSLMFMNATASTDSSTDRAFLSFSWDFGDGKTGYGEKVSHVYTSVGIYNVTLTATDNDGETGSFILLVTVISEKPRAFVNEMRIYGNYPEVQFRAIADDTPSDLLNLSYLWEFGDGCNASGSAVNHVYTSDGMYEVTLTVTDASGESSTASAWVIVSIDSDGDSITDANEEQYGTNPLSADSDSDSIIDYWEIFNYYTDPARSDSDDDNASDWYEIAYLGYYADTDHDGLKNPWDPDSDEDGMRDGDDPNPLMYDAPSGATFPIISVVKNITPGFDVVAGVRYADGCWHEPPTILLDDTPPLPGEEESIFPPLNVTVPVKIPHLLYIAIYYEEGANGSTPELLLALYTFDERLGDWRIFDDTYVDDVQNFVWGELTENGRTHTYNSALRDSDRDGLTDIEETSPSRRGGEAYWWSNPNDRDTDDDGLSDYKERKITLTCPRDIDTDDDGLADGWIESKDRWGQTNGQWEIGEIKGELGDDYGNGGYGTNPKNYDSDGDGLWDGWQDRNFNHIWEAGEDPGEIGDEAQFFRGGYRTNPMSPDTDNDMIKDSIDLEPHIDLWLHVDINIVHALDFMDNSGAADFAWEVIVRSPDDLYLDGAGLETTYEFDNDLIYYPSITYSFDIRDDIALYYATFKIYDIDDGTWKLCDISRSALAATIQYDVKRGDWTGDDYHSDSTGYGLVRGDEDGSTARGYADNDPYQNDCELFFDIRTNAVWVDRDHLTTWEEVNIYRSDPMMNNAEEDWDSDGIPNDYEALHGLDLKVNDAMNDLDGDIVPNLWEYELRDRGKSPDNPYDTYGFDLIVSLNWDADMTYLNNLGQGLRYLSSMLFEATNGYFLIRTVKLFEQSQSWNQADVRIHEGTSQPPETNIF